jgi:predicted component of type VI protein secretion system
MARNYRVHNPQDSSGPHTRSRLPQVTLEILRGRARQRIRPIVRPAFLIGSAADSDLMLGAAQFPAAHCYLLLNPEGVGLRWLGFAPDVLVNDRAVEKADLRDGDILRTGPYEFRIRIRSEDTDPNDNESEAGTPRSIKGSYHGRQSDSQNAAQHEIDGLLLAIRRAFGLGVQTAALSSVESKTVPPPHRQPLGSKVASMRQMRA